MKKNIVRQVLGDQTHKNMRGNTRLNAADIENQQFHSFYETKIFNFALKKVPKRVESRAWARSVTFLKRNIRNWSQSRDLTYEGDAISVLSSSPLFPLIADEVLREIQDRLHGRSLLALIFLIYKVSPLIPD